MHFVLWPFVHTFGSFLRKKSSDVKELLIFRNLGIVAFFWLFYKQLEVRNCFFVLNFAVGGVL